MAQLQADGLTLFLTGVLLLVSLLFFRFSKKRNLPPGPWGWPILGCYPYIRKDPFKSLTEMGRKYGGVLGMYIGSQYVVVLSDWDALVDAFSQASTIDRPPELFADVPYNFGIDGYNGLEWVQARRLATKAMKDIGLHDTRWEELVKEEASEAVQHILKHGEDPLDIKEFLSSIFCNNIMTLVLGERLPAGHPLTKHVSESVDTILGETPTLDINNFSPRLGKILELFGFEDKRQLSERLEDFGHTVSNIVDEDMQNPERKSEDSFINRYYREVVNNKDKPNNYLSEDNLKGNVVVLLAGGSETSRCTLIWTLMAMAENPDKQQKVQEELDRVLGEDGSIQWADRMKVPYTFATLLEAMRWRTIVPFTTMRIASTDIKVLGYDIPKGTFIFANSWAIHSDPKYWKDPEKFIPERFLIDDGKKVNSVPKSYNPFSYGKRNCPGKLIGLMEMLIFFCKFMHKFRVMPAEGKTVKHGTHLGLTYLATDVHLRFIPRGNV